MVGPTIANMMPSESYRMDLSAEAIGPLGSKRPPEQPANATVAIWVRIRRGLADGMAYSHCVR